MNDFVPNTEGVFPGLSEAEYRAAPGIGQSLLKAFDAEPTPTHFIESLTRPKEVTEAMEFGTILHTAILQPERLNEAYYVKPEPWDGRKTECKQWKSAHHDRPIIDKEQEASIPKIVATVASLPVAGDIIRTGQKEVSFFKRDEETGLLLKCRVDAIATDTDGLTHIADLKKVRRGYATATRFGTQCADLGYDIQCYSYLHITGASRFIFVAMEEEAPFEAETWELDAEDIISGCAKYRKILLRYAECLNTGLWPGYTKAVKRLKLPAWAKDRERLEPTSIYD